MKIYAVTKNLELKIWSSITEFTNENWAGKHKGWIDPQWIRICSKKDLPDFPFQKGLIIHSVLDIQAHDILYGVYCDVSGKNKKVAITIPELLELRQEITNVNELAGRTIFNPALTEILDRELGDIK